MPAEERIQVNWSGLARAVGVANAAHDGLHKAAHKIVRDVLGACDVPHADMFKHRAGPTYRPREARVVREDGSTERCVSRPTAADAKRDLRERIERGEIFTGVRFHSDPRVEHPEGDEARVVRGGASGIILPVREQLERVLERMSADGLLRIMPDFASMPLENVDVWLRRCGGHERTDSEDESSARDRAVRAHMRGCWG